MKDELIRLADKLIVAQCVAFFALLRRFTRVRVPNVEGPATWVVIKLVGMGDAVLMLPILAAIRAQSPQRLVVVTTGRCAAVFGAPGVADEVVILGRTRLFIRLRTLWSAMRDCDRVVDFEQHIFWSSAVALLARRQTRLFGFHSGSRRRNFVYDGAVDPGPAPRAMKEIFDELARRAGIAPAPGLTPLPVRQDRAARVESWVSANGLKKGEYLVVAPGSGAAAEFRRPTADQWAEILAKLPPDRAIVLAGTHKEAQLIAEIREKISARLPIVELDFHLEELGHLLRGAWKVVATDSGPMHLAAAMGASVVGIFGPDTPERYRPYNPISTSVTLNLPCSPCNNCWVYREARCTNPDRYACIRKLSTEAVLVALVGKANATQGGA